MSVYNKAKVKAWITAATKKTLIVRLDQELICDGYIVLKIDEDIKGILGGMLITESVMVKDGVKQSEMMDIRKYIDSDKGNHVEYIKTPLSHTQGKVQGTILLPSDKGEMHLVASRFFDLLDPKLTYLYTGGEKSTRPITVTHDDDFVAFMLPMRINNFGYKIEKVKED